MGWVLCAVMLAAMPAVTPGQTSSAKLDKGTGRVLTLVDYFEGGQSAVKDFLESGESAGGAQDLAQVIENSRQRCARIDLRSHEEEASYQSVTGSGVLVHGGRRLLTAGHIFQNEKDYQIVVTLPDGTIRQARLLAWEYVISEERTRDWAVLELLGPETISSIPPLRLGQTHKGDLTLVLGYPAQIGVNARGEVAYASTPDGGYLQPLTTLGAVEGTDPFLLSPRVGAVPIGGMSGGPVFNMSGELVGIFVSLLKATSESGAVYFYGVSEIGSLREWLED